MCLACMYIIVDGACMYMRYIPHAIGSAYCTFHRVLHSFLGEGSRQQRQSTNTFFHCSVLNLCCQGEPICHMLYHASIDIMFVCTSFCAFVVVVVPRGADARPCRVLFATCVAFCWVMSLFVTTTATKQLDGGCKSAWNVRSMMIN